MRLTGINVENDRNASMGCHVLNTEIAAITVDGATYSGAVLVSIFKKKFVYATTHNPNSLNLHDCFCTQNIKDSETPFMFAISKTGVTISSADHSNKKRLVMNGFHIYKKKA